VKIYLTYDYELFFGESTGSVEACMLNPTNRLLEMAKIYRAKMTFFIDVGHLIQLKKHGEDHPELHADFDKIESQIKAMVSDGHSVQLHIHPHWEKAKYVDGVWKFKMKGNYRLGGFRKEKITRIVTEYHTFLKELTNKPVTVFRAGGWCIQPFSRLKKVFNEVGIKIDSSVFPGGKFKSEHYDYDFTQAPRKDKYSFSNDVCQETTNGEFTEYPITSHFYRPFFYWRLYALGRLFPSRHKMVGDGIFLAQPGRKKSVLTSSIWNHASTDGYYASKMPVILKEKIKEHRHNLVFIGHPKGMTEFSFERTEDFIKINHTKHSFITLASQI
jgi:peptidoglycan/xylan/chitin deacetylase (PgdA/CDA1 family)